MHCRGQPPGAKSRAEKGREYNQRVEQSRKWEQRIISQESKVILPNSDVRGSCGLSPESVCLSDLEEAKSKCKRIVWSLVISATKPYHGWHWVGLGVTAWPQIHMPLPSKSCCREVGRDSVGSKSLRTIIIAYFSCQTEKTWLKFFVS